MLYEVITSAMGQSLGYRPEDLPATMRLTGRLLRLPIYASLTMQFVYSTDAFPELTETAFADMFGVWVNGEPVEILAPDGCYV